MTSKLVLNGNVSYRIVFVDIYCNVNVNRKPSTLNESQSNFCIVFIQFHIYPAGKGKTKTTKN